MDLWLDISTADDYHRRSIDNFTRQNSGKCSCRRTLNLLTILVPGITDCLDDLNLCDQQ